MRNEYSNGRNLDGYNTFEQEFPHEQEWGNQGENAQHSSNRSPEEILLGSGTPNDKRKNERKEKKKSTALSKIISFATATVVTVSVGTTIIPSKTQSEILECYSTDTSIGYTVTADESESDLVLVIENDNTKRTVDLQHGENVGDVFNLKPNMLYTLKITEKSGRATSAEEVSIRTKPSTLESVWYGIDYTPADDINGEFKFTPHYSDPTNRWVEFFVTVLDDCEYGFETTIEGNGVEHSVPLSQTIICSSKAYFEVYALTADEEYEFLYSREVSLLKKRTEWLGAEYTFDADNPTSLTVIPRYIDENGMWANITISVYDTYLGEIATTTVVGSDVAYELQFVPGENSELYLDVYAELTFGDYAEFIYLYGDVILPSSFQ